VTENVQSGICAAQHGILAGNRATAWSTVPPNETCCIPLKADPSEIVSAMMFPVTIPFAKQGERVNEIVHANPVPLWVRFADAVRYLQHIPFAHPITPVK
jgi:hypothetical protein